jgi:uncharacterized protein (DUF1015 family)
MAKISPFKAVHYNGSCASDLGRLISPPHDIISPRQQDQFYSAHENNIIRLVLGKQYPTDMEKDNRYSRAAATLSRWMDRGVLVRENRPSFTIYHMEFDAPHRGRASLDGLVALVEASDYGNGRVLPHEKTYKGPRQDQLNLLRACRANLTPIHALFDDKGNAVMDAYRPFMQGPPNQEAMEADGTVHRTWSLDNEDAISRIVNSFAQWSIFIADGHHRYETALAYRNEMRAQGAAADEDAPDYVMMFLTAMSHPGLTILPAHRMLKGIEEAAIGKLLDRLAQYFDIEQLSFDCADPDSRAQTMLSGVSSIPAAIGNYGVVMNKGCNVALIRLRSFEAVDRLIDAQTPGPLRDLDVTILRDVVIGYGLGLDGDQPEGRIEYSPAAVEAVERATTGEVQISFILNPTRVEQVQAAAELGCKLPHKSTYFYPKLASGMVLNVF